MAREAILHPIVWIVAFSSAAACLGSSEVAGYHITGYAWVTALICSALLLLRYFDKVTFPYCIWIPWIALILIYLSVAEAPNAFQRSMLLLCPIIVGMAVSCSYVQKTELSVFGRLCRYLALALLAIISCKSGLLLTGILPRYGGFAAEMMLGCLLSVQFAAAYAFGKKEALFWWVAMLTLPIIALTRTATVATAITLPFTLGPLRLPKRVLVLGIVCAIGVAVFSTPRMQKMMFYTGQGAISDLSWENPNFHTSGRKFIWDALTSRIEQRPWLGHGANASEFFLTALIGRSFDPHNDWLRLLYDYGIIGAVLFACCLIAQVIHALMTAINTTGECRVLFYAGASSFIPFVIFMFTDNIILYAAFFGNMQFTMLGLAYAVARTANAEEIDEESVEDESERPVPALPCNLA